MNGAIQTKEIVVETGWSDYVFAPGYPLLPLKDVASYIQENHHLPDIPSEAEVKKNGVNLGDMQAKLLAKIEELTLHVIAGEERNSRLEQRMKCLERRLANRESGSTDAAEGGVCGGGSMTGGKRTMKGLSRGWAVALIVAGCAWGQSKTGSIQGSVVGSDGTPLGGARVFAAHPPLLVLMEHRGSRGSDRGRSEPDRSPANRRPRHASRHHNS